MTPVRTASRSLAILGSGSASEPGFLNFLLFKWFRQKKQHTWGWKIFNLSRLVSFSVQQVMKDLCSCFTLLPLIQLLMLALMAPVSSNLVIVLLVNLKTWNFHTDPPASPKQLDIFICNFVSFDFSFDHEVSSEAPVAFKAWMLTTLVPRPFPAKPHYRSSLSFQPTLWWSCCHSSRCRLGGTSWEAPPSCWTGSFPPSQHRGRSLDTECKCRLPSCLLLSECLRK